jgi:hypothetical protein
MIFAAHESVIAKMAAANGLNWDMEPPPRFVIEKWRDRMFPRNNANSVMEFASVWARR